MYGRENNERVGCIKFWEQGRNPITMKKMCRRKYTSYTQSL